jgi:tetratricopeptide (TPR) repeat protein
VVAALSGSGVADAEDVVEQLSDLRLLEFAGDDAAGRARYRFHDLLRLFARERLDAEDERTEQLQAVQRMLGGYLAVARRGLYLLSPHSKRDPVRGVDVAQEHTALVGAVRVAHDWSQWPYTYELAEQLHYYLRVHGHLADWVDTHELALAAARREGDRRAEGWTLRNLGNAWLEQGRYADAAACFAAAAAIFVDLGNTLGSAATLCNLGETRMTQGLFAAAQTDLRRCLPDWQAVGDLVGVAYTVDNLGYIALCQGDFATASACLRRSLEMFVELGDGFGEAHSLRRRAELDLELGKLAEAERHLDRAEELFDGTRSASGKGWVALTGVALHLAKGRAVDALGAAAEAVTKFQNQENPRAAAQAMVRLGEVLVASDRRPEAVAVLEQAAHLLEQLGDQFGAGLATFHLGHAHGPATERGAGLLRDAAMRFESLPAPLWERRARGATVRS